MKITDFYGSLMSDLLIEDVTDDGRMSMIYDPENPQPLNIGGKRLTFPTKEVLKGKKGDDQIIFHPLSENITRGESDVIKSLRDLIQWRCQSVALVLLDVMCRVAATPSEHKGLPPKASKYLKQLPDMDEKTYLALGKLLKRVSPDPERRLISITLRQGSKTKDEGVLRSAMVHFPIFEDLARDDLEVFEMALPSKKAKARLAKLFEIVLGDEETRAAFSYGSNNMEAPYLHALLTSFERLATHFNKLVATHAKMLGADLAAELTMLLEWVPGLENFAALRSAVPPQNGNEGAIKVDVKGAREEAKAKAKATERAKPPRLAPPTDRPAADETLPWDEEERPLRPRVRQPEPVLRQREPEPSSGTSIGDFMDRLRGGDSRSGARGFGRESRLGFRDERETFGRNQTTSFSPGRNRRSSY